MYTMQKFITRLATAYLDGMQDMVTEICINSVHHRNLIKAVAQEIYNWDKSDDFWKAVAIRKEIAQQNKEAAESVI